MSKGKLLKMANRTLDLKLKPCLTLSLNILKGEILNGTYIAAT